MNLCPKELTRGHHGAAEIICRAAFNPPIAARDEVKAMPSQV